eukprot:6179093-Pleurochrysis_carterae.AAC.2
MGARRAAGGAGARRPVSKVKPRSECAESHSSQLQMSIFTWRKRAFALNRTLAGAMTARKDPASCCEGIWFVHG